LYYIDFAYQQITLQLNQTFAVCAALAHAQIFSFYFAFVLRVYFFVKAALVVITRYFLF